MLTNVAIVNGQDARIHNGYDNAEDGHNNGQAQADHIKCRNMVDGYRRWSIMLNMVHIIAVKPKLIIYNGQYVHLSHLCTCRRHPLPHPIETRGRVASLQEHFESKF